MVIIMIRQKWLEFILVTIMCEYGHIIGSKSVRSRGSGRAQRILLTDELREELTQAAAATSQAYAAGARNLSMVSSSTTPSGICLHTKINCTILNVN